MGIVAKKREDLFTEIDSRTERAEDIMDFFEAQQTCLEKNLKKHQPTPHPIESTK